MVTGPYLNAPGLVSVYERGIAVRVPDVPASRPGPGGARRAPITEFSRRSRQRLLRRFTQLQWSRVGVVRFVTLTWHHGHESDERRPAEVLNAALTRWRADWPGMMYVWRLEAQRRGAPHFHLLMMWEKGARAPGLDVVRGRCLEVWHRLADPHSEHHRTYGVDVQSATDYGKVWGYLSKYCAKEANNSAPAIPGRQWGTSRNLPTRPVFHAPLHASDWRRLRPIIRRILQSRDKCTASTLEWFDGAASMHLYITADELRTADPHEWAALRKRGSTLRALAQSHGVSRRASTGQHLQASMFASI